MGTCLSDFWARLSVKSQHPYLAGLTPKSPGAFCIFYSNYTLLPHYGAMFIFSLLGALRDSNCQHSRGMRRQWCSTDIKCGYASVWFIFLRMRSKTWVALLVSICTWRRRKTCPQTNPALFRSCTDFLFVLPSQSGWPEPAHPRSAASQNSLNACKCEKKRRGLRSSQ